MSPRKKAAPKPKGKATMAKKATPDPTPDYGPPGTYLMWVLPPRKAKCPKTLNALCPAVEDWTKRWFIWAEEVTRALNNGSCCSRADVMSQPFFINVCPSRPERLAAVFRYWAAGMMVWAWDADVNLGDCFRAWKTLTRKPRFPTPPEKRRPVRVEEVCKEINAFARSMQKWAAEVKKVMDQHGCDTGNPTGVSDPPDPPFD